ncbi:MAG: tetratricopeptide repeat protein [Methanoregula sp.]|uniref:tetratricopeptide repeat protein n=2 Tax=Methanoregula sp. TaxID=2052170 RepID=UPI003C45E9A6
MKRGQILGMLALLLVCAVTVIPAMAANVTVTTTHDVATDYYNYGGLALEAGNYSDAIAYYDQALGSNTTMMNLAGALLYVYQDKSYAQIKMGNYTGALATLNAGLVVYPNDENLLNNKGYAQYNLGNYADAVTSYDQALTSDANFTTALINKGDALEKLGNYHDAVTAYKAALASDPGNTAATTKLAGAEKAAASALPYTLIVLAVVVVVIAAGVAYYVTRKTPAGGKAQEEPDKKAGKKKK